MSHFQFHTKEFQSMMFNVDKIPEGTSVLTFYKELGKIKEFKASAGEDIDNDKVNLFVLLMYDKNSPYRRKYSDPLKRKVEIAHDVAFEIIEGGVFESPVEDILKGRNEIVNKKIVQFVRMHRNYNYSYQISVETAYSNLMLEIQSGETKGLKALADMRDDLERNLMEMLNQDNNPYLKDEMLRYMESERLALRPEDIAKRSRDGEPLVTLKKGKV
jgi:hypothetical protein